MARRVSVRGLVLHDGKILCVKLKPYHKSIRGDFWCLPGGGLDENEDLQAGVVREMIEETGVKPEVGELLYIQQFVHEGTDILEFFFLIKNSKDYLDIDLSKASHAAEEIAGIAFVDPKTTAVKPEFLSTDPLEQFALEGKVRLKIRYR